MNEEIKTKLPEIPSVMVELTNVLDEAGFKTTRVNPFHAWINLEYLQGDSPGNAATTKIYITDIAVPQVAPFDIAFIEIHLDCDRFYLALTICFHSVMEGLLEAEEFNEVLSKHDELWMLQLVRLFQPAEITFQLKWDTEYDVTIEDTLYGYFPLSDMDKVIAAIRSINSCKE
jgi:hypothetical protein